MIVLGGDGLGAVGHRVVHGGAAFTKPVRIDGSVLDQLTALCPLAPLHQPKNLSAIRWVEAARPRLAQVACFDTAFHAGHAPVITRFGLPRRYEEEGVRRYGFHGLSYEYVAGRLKTLAPALAAGWVIVAHLGSGSSLCALSDGRSVDTTMGMTPLDGLVMATRSGAIDPGVIPYLQRRHAMTCDEVEEMLYHRSGLLGVSQLSGDLRELLASENPKARDAVDLYVFRIAREAGALASSLGGLDGFVFTGGIGENSPLVRSRVGERLAWLGVAVDEAGNGRGERSIGGPNGRAAAWIIPTDEERMIAVHVRETIGLAARPGTD
jgi:acetate kinase